MVGFIYTLAIKVSAEKISFLQYNKARIKFYQPVLM
jgi:hypothetical protein